MKILIYDPPMCCPSGVCGPSVDPKLAKLQETLRKLEQTGISVQRFNLASEPQAFVDNAEVGELLRTGGNGVLPLTFIDGEILQKARYPENAEFEQALRRHGIDADLSPAAKPAPPAAEARPSADPAVAGLNSTGGVREIARPPICSSTVIIKHSADHNSPCPLFA